MLNTKYFNCTDCPKYICTVHCTVVLSFRAEEILTCKLLPVHWSKVAWKPIGSCSLNITRSPHALSRKTATVENSTHLALPIVLKGLSRSVLNGLRSAEFKCSGCFQTLSPSNLKLAPFYVIQKTWWKVSAFGQLWYQASGLRYRPI